MSVHIKNNHAVRVFANNPINFTHFYILNVLVSSGLSIRTCMHVHIHKPASNTACSCEGSTSPLSGVRGSGTPCSLDGMLLSSPAQGDI